MVYGKYISTAVHTGSILQYILACQLVYLLCTIACTIAYLLVHLLVHRWILKRAECTHYGVFSALDKGVFLSVYRV